MYIYIYIYIYSYDFTYTKSWPDHLRFGWITSLTQGRFPNSYKSNKF